MPAVVVHVPAVLSSPEPARDIACEAATVGEALLAVAARAPQYEQRIFYGDRLLVTVAVNGRHLPHADVERTLLAAGDRVDLLPPVAGG